MSSYLSQLYEERTQLTELRDRGFTFDNKRLNHIEKYIALQNEYDKLYSRVECSGSLGTTPSQRSVLLKDLKAARS